MTAAPHKNRRPNDPEKHSLVVGKNPRNPELPVCSLPLANNSNDPEPQEKQSLWYWKPSPWDP